MAKLITLNLSSGAGTVVKPEPQNNGAKTSDDEPVVQLCKLIRASEEMRSLHALEMHMTVGTQRYANDLYNLHFGWAKDTKKAWDLSEEDEKTGAKWALSFLINDEKYANAAVLIKEFKFNGTDIMEAIGLSVLHSKEIQSLHKKVDSDVLNILEEVKRVLPEQDYQALLR